MGAVSRLCVGRLRGTGVWVFGLAVSILVLVRRAATGAASILTGQGIIYQMWGMADPDEKWKELCAKAAVEKDPQRLLALVQEINRLFEEKDKLKQPPTGGKPQ